MSAYIPTTESVAVRRRLRRDITVPHALVIDPDVTDEAVRWYLRMRLWTDPITGDAAVQIPRDDPGLVASLVVLQTRGYVTVDADGSFRVADGSDR